MSNMLAALFLGEAEGAIPNGSRISKQNSEAGDGHADGTPGVVVSSVKTPQEMLDDGFDPYFYFVDWGDGVPVGTTSKKVKENTNGS